MSPPTSKITPPREISKNLKIILFIIPICYLICAVLIKIYHPGAYERYFLREDALFENLSAVAYFLAFFISLAIAVQFRKEASKLNSFIALMYFLLAIGLFFVGMEEISWGQRIFHVHTFSWFSHNNRQHEINLHNLKWVPLHLSFIVVGLYGAFSRIAIPRKTMKKYLNLLDLFFPRWYLFFYFFSTAAIYLYYDYLSQPLVHWFGDMFAWGNGHFLLGKDQETPEFLLSAGFLLFVCINWAKIHHKAPGAKLANSL